MVTTINQSQTTTCQKSNFEMNTSINSNPAISNVLCWIITEAFEITDLSNNSDVYKVAITGGGDR